jgi:muconate cycloisomerase
VAEWVAAIRAACGTRIKVLLDPNQRWHDAATTRRRMAGVDPACMYGLEDPIARADYAGFRELRQSLGILVFIHIAIPYLSQGQRAADVLTALREECVDGFNFNGPMAEFVRLADLAALAGKPCWHGSEVDLGLLEVSALHAAAASPACTIPSDLFGELVRENDLIEPGIRFTDGYALVPTGPGLGVELDRAALARYRSGPALIVN